MAEKKIELLDPSIKIEKVERGAQIIICGEHKGHTKCIHCGATDLKIKDRITRDLRHASIGIMPCVLRLTFRKYYCSSCGRYFRGRVPGVLPYRRSTEWFRREVCHHHQHGESQSYLSSHFKMGKATVERWMHEYYDRGVRERSNRPCPKVLGIDEHYFSRKLGYVTTLASLKGGKVFDLLPGRSEAALSRHLKRLKGRERVKVVCMDLSPTYRNIAREYFPNALIVSDRFHVVRLVNHHMLESWKQLDPVGRRNRGLLSLMRRRSDRLKPEQKQRLDLYLKEHPAVGALYQAKEDLHKLLCERRHSRHSCRPLAGRLLSWIDQLKDSPLPSMNTLGKTLYGWRDEIARMWRFTKNNSITEGLHTKMEMIQRRAFGFKNFENYRLRVLTLCG